MHKIVMFLILMFSFFSSAIAQNEIFYWAKPNEKYDAEIASRDALAYLRLGTVVVLMLGGPASEAEERIRIEEYRRHEIEWRYIGDVTTPEFEEYRREFNAVMKKAVEDRMGNDFFPEIENRIRTRIKKEEDLGKTKKTPCK